MRQIPGQASGILSYFTRHPTVANLLLVILVAAGLLAGPNMRAQFFPDVIDDDVTVNVSWDGAGAEDRAVARADAAGSRGGGRHHQPVA